MAEKAAGSELADLPEQRQKLPDAIRKDPNNVVLYLRRAVVYSDMGYPDLALGDTFRVGRLACMKVLVTKSCCIKALVETAGRQRLRQSGGHDGDYNPLKLSDGGFARREVYPWKFHEPDRCSPASVAFLNQQLAEDKAAGATRPGGIAAGQEILCQYCDVDLPVQLRRDWARGTLSGTCICQRCRNEAAAEQGSLATSCAHPACICSFYK
ncbi:hypothetical protein SEPCBS119000_000446 [Sporothrix epigloea]|uniref:Uncharacterized protein n=1 Tax=Sporothrix epigloea TaxID=1892477 RepID=A0ABP0D599_9PEZI